VIKQGILENQVNISFLGIGSNLGNRKKYIQHAKYLIQNSNMQIIKSSSIYETPSWPNLNHPKYYNIVLKIKTSLNPANLFRNIKAIERKLGRQESKKNYPRTCDIDIIDFNGKNFKIEINGQMLLIPHPRLTHRNFVLLPLFEIDKKWSHPEKKTRIIDLIANLSTNSLRAIKLI